MVVRFSSMKLFPIMLLLLISTVGYSGNDSFNATENISLFEQHDEHGSSNEETHNSEVKESHDTEHEEGHQTDTAPLLFIILAIIIGVATRHFVKRSPFPFTVLLLIIGLVLGVMNRFGLFEELHILDFNLELSAISKSIEFAANMDPHMLLFIFLPILIFERINAIG